MSKTTYPLPCPTCGQIRQFANELARKAAIKSANECKPCAKITRVSPERMTAKKALVEKERIYNMNLNRETPEQIKERIRRRAQLLIWGVES